MDEEDIQELKDSKKLVDATEEMDFLGGTQAEQRGGVDDEFEKEYVPFSSSYS
jgi:G patch domain-containing protein 1